MFFAEVGVGVVYSLHFPYKTQCDDVAKTGSSFLVLHFCNAVAFLVLAQNISTVSLERSTMAPERARLYSLGCAFKQVRARLAGEQVQSISRARESNL